MPHSAVKLTYADLLALPADGLRHEILDGEHHVSPAPALRHQRVLRKLLVRLDAWVEAHHLGEVFCAPLDVYLSEHDVVEPDLLFVSADRQAAIEEKMVRGAPDLVVEILSPSNRKVDLGPKRRAYQRFGAREYWIVDPDAHTIEVGRIGDTRAPSIYGRSAGTPMLTSPLFPGLILDLDEVFEPPPHP